MKSTYAWSALAGALSVACSGGGGGGGGGGATATTTALFTANDLGMHCMDREYSVFSILPPYNVVRAQVVRRVAGGAPMLLDDVDVELRYSGVADPRGSINTTSKAKSDFWQHALLLFGAQLQPGEGLKGLYMPADAVPPGPQPVAWNTAQQLFAAEGIPMTPLDDLGATNTYPLLRITAFDKLSGAELAHSDVVVPVAQETDCSNCHRSNGIAAVDPGVTWSNDPDLELQTKLNVLLLHDFREGTGLSALQPVLCASCHYSPALDLAGAGPNAQQINHATMSGAMHAFHGAQTSGGQPVFPPNGDALSTCYQCHPGAITRCARGAMAGGGMECLNCHGDMAAVGGVHPLLPGGSIDGTNDLMPRRPWTDLPRCQSCHTGDALTHLVGLDVVEANDGIRLKQAYRVGDASASAIAQPNSRFAENSGKLYRYSTGHGGVACQFCHGSTHAEWPVIDPLANDNKFATLAQGHSGPIIECGACHASGSLALTIDGPHGMHNVADGRWLDEKHGHFFDQAPNGCKACHGNDLRGTALSRVARDRSFHVEGHTIAMPKGTPVACDRCHSMP